MWATARKVDSISDLAKQNIQVEELDVTSEEQIQRVISQIKTVDGHLGMLVNNAGYGGMGPLLETSADELERQFTTNVFAPMALVRAVAPIMCNRGQGMIVNIGSIFWYFGDAFFRKLLCQ